MQLVLASFLGNRAQAEDSIACARTWGLVQMTADPMPAHVTAAPKHTHAHTHLRADDERGMLALTRGFARRAEIAAGSVNGTNLVAGLASTANRVVSLDFTGCGGLRQIDLSAILTPEVCSALAPHLEHLRAVGTELTGRVPPCVFDLRRLRTLDLKLNRLRGALPGIVPRAVFKTCTCAMPCCKCAVCMRRLLPALPASAAVSTCAEAHDQSIESLCQ